MRKKSCHLENEVMDCLKAGKLSPEIKKHLSECPYCKEVASIHKWVKQLKNRSWNAVMAEKVLPEPETIWNRVYAKRRPDRELVKKALRPLIYPRVFSYPILIIGVIFLFLSNMKEIGNTIASSLLTGPALDAFSKIITQFFPLFLIPMFIVFFSMLFCVFVVALEKLKKTA
jgi:Fe2+ transport system protein B